MIKIENVSTAGWEAAIRGMRNPMNSWEKSDTLFWDRFSDHNGDLFHTLNEPEIYKDVYYMSNDMEEIVEKAHAIIGPNDMKLMKSLVAGGSVHAKFRRFIDVTVDIVAPLYWWKDFDTYRIGRADQSDDYQPHDIEYDSCSTMHKIHAKEFTMEDFSVEHLGLGCESAMKETISSLNAIRRAFLETKSKDIWDQLIHLLPSSYNQRRTVKLNYEVLAGLYPMRRDHKLNEFREFCAWIETLPYAKELIIGFQMRTDIYKPTVLSKDLITVNVCEEKDGLIELRRGVPALYLGNGIEYCQARILVGDDQYIKGMCVYKDDMPEDCDVIVNTRDKDTVFKDLDYKCAFSRYSKQPLKQRFYESPRTGEFEISPINYIPWEVDWDLWAKKLPNTFTAACYCIDCKFHGDATDRTRCTNHKDVKLHTTDGWFCQDAEPKKRRNHDNG